MNELAEYKTTKSALQLPLDRAVPVSLIKKLVRNAIRRHEAVNKTRRQVEGKRPKSRDGTTIAFNELEKKDRYFFLK